MKGINKYVLFMIAFGYRSSLGCFSFSWSETLEFEQQLFLIHSNLFCFHRSVQKHKNKNELFDSFFLCAFKLGTSESQIECALIASCRRLDFATIPRMKLADCCKLSRKRLNFTVNLIYSFYVEHNKTGSF